MNTPIGWHKQINVQVDSTPQEREFGFGMMEFNCMLEFTLSVNNGPYTMSKKYFWFNGKSPSLNESMRIAFQSFLDKDLFSTDHKIFDFDSRGCPPISQLKTFFICDNEFLSQIFSEMFPNCEMIGDQLMLAQ